MIVWCQYSISFITFFWEFQPPPPTFEKKALSKVVELSKLDPIKVFEDKVLEKVKMNRKWAEQRTEFLLKKIKRKERADSTEEEKCEIYISESDDSSDE